MHELAVIHPDSFPIWPGACLGFPPSAVILTIQLLAACITKGKQCNEAFALVCLLLLILPRAGPEAEPFLSLTSLLQDYVNLLSTEAIIHPS